MKLLLGVSVFKSELCFKERDFGTMVYQRQKGVISFFKSAK